MSSVALSATRFGVFRSSLPRAGCGLFNLSDRVLVPGEHPLKELEPRLEQELHCCINDARYTPPSSYLKMVEVAHSIAVSQVDDVHKRKNNLDWDQERDCLKVIRPILPGEELLRPYNSLGILSGIALDVVGANWKNPEMPVLSLEERRRGWRLLKYLGKQTRIEFKLGSNFLKDEQSWSTEGNCPLEIVASENPQGTQFVVLRPWANFEPEKGTSDRFELWREGYAAYVAERRQLLNQVLLTCVSSRDSLLKEFLEEYFHPLNSSRPLFERKTADEWW